MDSQYSRVKRGWNRKISGAANKAVRESKSWDDGYVVVSVDPKENLSVYHTISGEYQQGEIPVATLRTDRDIKKTGGFDKTQVEEDIANGLLSEGVVSVADLQD
ncbi:MAG: hypothetical protein KGN01_06390 [Patescibacteria group bacterium]|nr:hypothetical protein [Patescibacteria group bacterium]